MEKATSKVTVVLTSTALAAAVTMVLGWPSHVNAGGNEELAVQQQAALAEREAAPENAELAQNASKIGDLTVTATLAQSETGSGRQIIRLECNNPTGNRIDGTIQVALTRTSGTGMERVMPAPKIAWRHNEKVAVEPGATLIRELVLPKNIGAEVARIEKQQKAAMESDRVRNPNVYFGVVADGIEPPSAVAAKGRASKRPSLTIVPPDAPEAPTAVAAIAQPAQTDPPPKEAAAVSTASNASASNASSSRPSASPGQHRATQDLAMSNPRLAVRPERTIDNLRH
jgi:hypothetical protein